MCNAGTNKCVQVCAYKCHCADAIVAVSEGCVSGCRV